MLAAQLVSAVLWFAALSGVTCFVDGFVFPGQAFRTKSDHASGSKRPTAAAAIAAAQRTADPRAHRGGAGFHSRSNSFKLATGVPSIIRQRRSSSALSAEMSSDGAEETAVASTTASGGSSDDALVEAAGDAIAPSDSGAGGEGRSGIDLAKGIAFEAPKSAGVSGDVEEEASDAKKVRVILYTALSLVPFLLLIPFLGSRDFIPMEPGQM